MKKVLLLTVIILLCGLSLSAQNRVFVDLGLSSGTKWCTKNETDYWSHSNAQKSFGSTLPSIEQFSELIAECEWTWTGTGYRVKGPNGKTIYLPADGAETDRKGHCDFFTSEKGSFGAYWSSAPLEAPIDGDRLAMGLLFDNNSYQTFGLGAVVRDQTCGYMYALRSVRLVK